jgi:VanZ family protein
MRFKINPWILTILWMGIIFAGSSFELKPGASPFTYADKVAHFFEFGLLGILLFCSLKRSFAHLPATVLILLATALTGMYGLSDEIHQLYVPTREFSGYDIIADVSGGFACTLCWYLFLRKLRKI